MVDTRMGDGSQKLVDAWPRNDPGKRAFCELPKAISGLLVPWTGAYFRIDENVGVDRLRCSAAIHEV